MKYARCPNCKGRLGIPNKKRGLPVLCPKCGTEFVAPDHLDNKPAKSKKKSNGSPKKPSMRGLPMPGAIANANTENESTANSAMLPPSASVSTPADSMMPPTGPSSKPPKAKSSSPKPIPNSELSPPGPPSPPGANIPVANPLDAPVPTAQPIDTSPPVSMSPPAPSSATPTTSPPPTAAPVAAAIPTTPAPLPTPGPAQKEKTMEVTPTVVPKKSESRSVARIVKTESVAPQLSKDGKLPTLQLADDEEETKVETKTNPVLLTAVICGSLFFSTLLLVFFRGGDGEKKAKMLEESRQIVQTFYEVRPDQELKPYQRELRRAQLAHSRQDYGIAIGAYESVMSRLNSEEHNEFSGVTGTAQSDLQLRKHVAILLTEAKRQRR